MAFRSSLKKPQSPCSGLTGKLFRVAGSLTGRGRSYLETESGTLGPVRLIAETPRFLFFSRFRITCISREVPQENNLDGVVDV
jgi:hypothetical protein